LSNQQLQSTEVHNISHILRENSQTPKHCR